MGAHLKKLSFSATTVKPVFWDRSSVLLLTRLPVFSRYSICMPSQACFHPALLISCLWLEDSTTMP